MNDPLHPELRLLTPAFLDKRLSILRALPLVRGDGPPIVVFNSIGKRGEPPEFQATVARLRRPVIFVIDHWETWYAAPQTADCVADAVQSALLDWGETRVDTLGFSMGAYGAITLAERVPVRHAVALAPRFSADPAIVPDPRERKALRNLSGRLAFPTVEPGLQRIGGGLILHGMRGPDICQFPHIRAPVGVDHWLLPKAGHFVVDWLRERGRMQEVVMSGLQGDRAETDRLMSGLGAVRHHSLRARLILHPMRMIGSLRTRLAKPADRG